MFKLFKKIVSPKLEVNLGKIDLNSKLKIKKYKKNNSNEIHLNKVNSKIKYYTKLFGKNNSEILNLSPIAKRKIKEFPQIISFIKKSIFSTKSLKIYSTNNFFFENKKLKINLTEMLGLKGHHHKNIFKLNVFYKKGAFSENYFIKISKGNFLANEEFTSNQRFQRFGINTIKPHFAYTNTKLKSSIIVYDFTNMYTLSTAVKDKLVTNKEFRQILNKVNELYTHSDELGLADYFKKGIDDFKNDNNIFVKKIDGEIKLFFTDLMLYDKSSISSNKRF